MTHAVETVAALFRGLLLDRTDAQDRVTRDRAVSPAADTDLPTIDIRIGDEEPYGDQSNTTYVGIVQIDVVLSVAAADENVSFAVLELRRQAHVAIMSGASGFLGIQAAGASGVVRDDSEGSVPAGTQTAHFQVLFQHSLADPAG